LTKSSGSLARTSAGSLSGVTMPKEMISLAASSTDMSIGIVFDRGVYSRKPEVGLGVVGTKRPTTSSEMCLRSSELPPAETKATT
jgi:hypothetical protein